MNTGNGLKSRRGCDEAASYQCYWSACSSLLRYTSYCFSEDEAIVRGLVRLNGSGVVGGEEKEPLARVRKAVWGMYADDAGFVSKWAERLAKRMAAIASVFEAATTTVVETRTDTVLLRKTEQATLAPPLVIEAACQRCYQAT